MLLYYSCNDGGIRCISLRSPYRACAVRPRPRTKTLCAEHARCGSRKLSGAAREPGERISFPKGTLLNIVFDKVIIRVLIADFYSVQISLSAMVIFGSIALHWISGSLVSDNTTMSLPPHVGTAATISRYQSVFYCRLIVSELKHELCFSLHRCCLACCVFTEFSPCFRNQIWFYR